MNSNLKGIIQGASNRLLQKVGAVSKTTQALADSRLAICQKCEIFDTATLRCDSTKGGCGCYMKTKTLVPSAKCPKAKW